MASPFLPYVQKSAKKCKAPIKALKPMWLLKRNISLEYGMELHGVETALYIHSIEMEKFLKLPSLHLTPPVYKKANQANGCTLVLSSSSVISF